MEQHHQRPLWLSRLLLALLLITILANAYVAIHSSMRRQNPSQANPRIQNLAIPELNHNYELKPTPPSALRWLTYTLKPGDSLYAVLQRYGIDNATLHAITTLPLAQNAFTHLKPGSQLHVALEAHGQLKQLIYPLDFQEQLVIEFDQTSQLWQARMTRSALEPHIHFAETTIDSSFYEAGAKANIPEKLIQQLVNLFSWDVDFARNVYPGDKFSLLYEDYYLKDHKVATGGILAASFINRGKTFRFIRYTDPEGHVGYYSPDGRSMKKAFLRAPVKYIRISSRFTRRRYHPVLNVFRSHKGIDYAAPKGTPIHATGKGRVLFVGRRGGYGKVVMLQHGKRYRTVYAHMSRFAPRLRKHAAIAQGQVIGFVGQTGLATGPHCHYEFRINNHHFDPLRVNLPKAKPIPERYRLHFLQQAQNVLAELDLLEKAKYAALEVNKVVE